MNLAHCILIVCFLPGAAGTAFANSAITFNRNFEGGSLGKIEKLGETQFRCWVEGQHDERGRNRQANWYFFRMDNLSGREVTLTLTDFVGEYNDRPGACPMNAQLRPVFSNDGERWQHFERMEWNDTKKEATLKFRPERDNIWVAHVPPYTHSRLLRLVGEVDRLPSARVEVIGKTAQGRDLHLVTVTDFEQPDNGKKTIWLQARQHAWETGTSFVMEGAVRFATSDDVKARELRKKIIFKFTPMMDPDGCAAGKVRFNANGYDVNRHWDKVDLRDKKFLSMMPEIWYVKKAILGYVDSDRPIEFMINMHNTETSEFLGTMVEGALFEKLRQLEENLLAKTTFDPSRRLELSSNPPDTTNYLWKERKIPTLLMEQRIGAGKKLGRYPTVDDRLDFGRNLITVMAETALEMPPK